MDLPNVSPLTVGTVNAGDYYNPESPTCGLDAAIAALPPAGGRVYLPAGNFVLRSSIYLPSRVCLVGEGPASVLAIASSETAQLDRDGRRGAKSFVCRGEPPFGIGDEVGLVDDQMRGWWGTHGHVTRIEGRRVHLDQALVRPLTVGRGAVAVGLFPAVRSLDEEDVEVCDLSVTGPLGGSNGPWWDFTYAGIHLHRCKRVRVVRCSVRRWASDGIGVQGGSDAQIVQCQAHDCRGHGFHPGTSLARSIWSQNVARGNGGDGLFFCARVHYSTCSESVFADNGLNGIGGVANGGDHHNIVSDNVCSGNGRSGIDANSGAEQLIRGNLLVDNSREDVGRWPAIRLHDLTHSIVQGNRCADSGERLQRRGIVESGTSNFNLIQGNHCLGMDEGVSTVGTHSRVEGNLF